jgi:hypothetical protein
VVENQIATGIVIGIVIRFVINPDLPGDRFGVCSTVELFSARWAGSTGFQSSPAANAGAAEAAIRHKNRANGR